MFCIKSNQRDAMYQPPDWVVRSAPCQHEIKTYVSPTQKERSWVMYVLTTPQNFEILCSAYYVSWLLKFLLLHLTSFLSSSLQIFNSLIANNHVSIAVCKAE